MLIRPLLEGLINVRYASSKSASSSRYLARQKKDHFVKSRQQGQYVSRSAYKLIELDEKFGFLSRKSNSRRVVDLGASPGGWTQVGLERIQKGGHVFAVDLLDLDDQVSNSSLLDQKKLTFCKGDFSSSSVQDQLKLSLSGDMDLKADVDVVMSDMMVNMSGNPIRDNEALLDLHHHVAAFAQQTLCKTGWMIVKFFESQEAQDFRKRRLEAQFNKIWTKKPEASRSESREAYWICHGLRQ